MRQPASDSSNARYSASPTGIASGAKSDGKHLMRSAYIKPFGAHTSMNCSVLAAREVFAPTRRGGATTRSSTVVKTTGSASVSGVVATAVPAGTRTGVLRMVESQNVSSVEATDGPNGSTPT